MIAAIGSVPYNIMLFLHIVSAMVGFAPIFVQPLLVGRANRDVMEAIAHKTLRIYGNAIIFSGFIGFGVAGLSDKVYRVRQPWLIVAVIVWVAIVGCLHAGVIPAERAIAAAGERRDKAAERKVQRFGTAVTVLFLVQIYLMVFKPGI
ncbi:MAG: hypothetical protein AAGC53_12790 [Actinomycetota bacterium]